MNPVENPSSFTFLSLLRRAKPRVAPRTGQDRCQESRSAYCLVPHLSKLDSLQRRENSKVHTKENQKRLYSTYDRRHKYRHILIQECDAAGKDTSDVGAKRRQHDERYREVTAIVIRGFRIAFTIFGDTFSAKRST